MRRDIVSPLASALVIPGLGQIINRQLGKGSVLIMLVSVWFMAALFLAFNKVTQALMSISEELNEAQRIAAIQKELLGQDTAWLWVLGISFGLIWLLAVVDAFRNGKRLDSEAAAANAARAEEPAEEKAEA